MLAAGLGKRMLPLTKTTPKPLLKIAGKPIIDYTIDALKEAGVDRVTINGHHMADQVEAYAKTLKDIDVSFSYEHDVLETGGGAKQALHTMPKHGPFFMVNGDAFWHDDDPAKNVFKRLNASWHKDEMDILLVLEPVTRMKLTAPSGDYDIDENGRLTRNKDRAGTHMFTGIRITHSRVFEFKSFGRFSFLECMDEAEAAGRLFGIEHKGAWHHISTPEDLEAVENSLAEDRAHG